MGIWNIVIFEALTDIETLWFWIKTLQFVILATPACHDELAVCSDSVTSVWAEQGYVCKWMEIQQWVCVTHLSEGVCSCVPVCVCILANSLFAGVCEEWIVTYSSRSLCARHLYIGQSLKSDQTKQKAQSSMSTQMQTHWLFFSSAAQQDPLKSIELDFFVLNWVLKKEKTCMQTCDHMADIQRSAAD